MSDAVDRVRAWARMSRTTMNMRIQAAVRHENLDDIDTVLNGLEHAHTELAKAGNDHQEFALAIGFGSDPRPEGHGVWVSELADMVDPINEALSTARDHIECPVVCGNCGERLADAVCEHCHGSGCGPGTASGAYEECEWCAGAGKVHPGCVGKSYSELVVDFGKLAHVIEQVREWADASKYLIPDYQRIALARILNEAERGEGS